MAPALPGRYPDTPPDTTRHRTARWQPTAPEPVPHRCWPRRESAGAPHARHRAGSAPGAESRRRLHPGWPRGNAPGRSRGPGAAPAGPRNARSAPKAPARWRPRPGNAPGTTRHRTAPAPGGAAADFPAASLRAYLTLLMLPIAQIVHQRVGAPLTHIVVTLQVEGGVE